MAEVELNYQRNYKITDQDAYDARCGEIFITFGRVLVFHCSFCDSKHKYFNSFLEHLSTHYQEHEISNTNETLNDIADISNDLENETKSLSDNSKRKYENEVKEGGCSEVSELLDKPTEIVDMEEQYLEDFKSENVDTVGALDETLHDYHELQCQRENSLTEAHKVDIFGCNICGKNFKSKPKLNRHLSIHSEERKFKCTICGFAFKEKANLNAHLRRHSGQKTIGCGVCSKKFFTRTEVENHMRVHTGEKPYICPHCGMTFAALSGMIRCVKRHTEEPPYKCSVCEKGFWSRAEFRDHLVVHTKEKPYACPICPARFPRRKSWRYHVKLHNRS